MKAIFISFDQAHYERIIDLLERNNCRGFTSWQQVMGRGSRTGEPHYGSHAWPSMASAIMTIVEDSRVDNVLSRLKAIDDERPKLGLRAFVWNIEKTIRDTAIETIARALTVTHGGKFTIDISTACATEI